ncbi:hypothetical protein CKF54_07230 [Psittacicella hinzii]|uniref:Uncharacterized protein n=1 Tax=Psittacicella hinzii TaxID=2028575 RepID=A0A3A1XYU7_9GAMM|nr:DUF6693 family protein [Psittacicella hinzii]RIY31202.1 hypothetical protein CKF54_07230 [Psittacicella hinzii]
MNTTNPNGQGTATTATPTAPHATTATPFKDSNISFLQYRLKNDLGIGEIILAIIVWALLIIFTLGIAALFFQYYQYKKVISNTYIVDKTTNVRVARLQCNLALNQMIGYILIYFVLGILTLGLAFLVFAYKALAHALSETTIVYV